MISTVSIWGRFEIRARLIGRSVPLEGALPTVNYYRDSRNMVNFKVSKRPSFINHFNPRVYNRTVTALASADDVRNGVCLAATVATLYSAVKALCLSFTALLRHGLLSQ